MSFQQPLPISIQVRRQTPLAAEGVQFSSGVIPVNMLAMSSGPQLGVYSFEYSGSWPSALDVRVEEIHGFTRIP